jgi:hypothetical protein
MRDLKKSRYDDWYTDWFMDRYYLKLRQDQRRAVQAILFMQATGSECQLEPGAGNRMVTSSFATTGKTNRNGYR